MYNQEVYNALTEVLTNHQSDIDYATDVVKALEEKLEEAKESLANEMKVHDQLVRVRKQFSPNAIDRILADREFTD